MAQTSTSDTRRAAQVLLGGGTVVVPTDTVYGLAAHPERAEAIDRLFALKGRDHSNPLAVLAADAGQALALFDLDGMDSGIVDAVRSLAAMWPGALTLVGPRATSWSHIDLGGDATTIGVRVPDSPVVRGIAAVVGPIVTTSANRSGEPTPTDATRAAASLADPVDFVIDTGECGGVPSTVIDVTTVPFSVLRHGMLDPAALGLADGVIHA
ncbi:MAG: threonylcarbamoyl-AMP synthase [Actinobacteria bacterium]|nr:threonylcarbamoyl-AMP synthase [Actinomycetota bacterium]